VEDEREPEEPARRQEVGHAATLRRAASLTPPKFGK
jgi:hypothetical protein